MPVHTVYRHGGKGGVPPGTNGHARMKRGQVEGWSVGATRRNTSFLMSVREPDLTGAGLALTLTLRDCPPTPAEWHRLRKVWTDRMRRAGMVRLHWITEWQRRGVPHLHCAIWWPEVYDFVTPITAWLELAAPFGAGQGGQQARQIDGPIGWFRYLSKHAARGVKHYQRTHENIPAGWQSKTGRVWGHSGVWPLDEPRKFGIGELDGDPGWFRLRRMVRGWRRAESRASGDRYRIRSARSMLRYHDPALSRLRGYSEWMPGEEVQLRMLVNLAERGSVVVDRSTGEVLCGPATP